MVSLSPDTGYVHLDSLEWSETQLKQGQIVKLKEIPFKVRLFKLVVTNGNTFWVITNDLELDNAQVIQAASWVRTVSVSQGP